MSRSRSRARRGSHRLLCMAAMLQLWFCFAALLSLLLSSLLCVSLCLRVYVFVFWFCVCGIKFIFWLFFVLWLTSGAPRSVCGEVHTAALHGARRAHCGVPCGLHDHCGGPGGRAPSHTRRCCVIPHTTPTTRPGRLNASGCRCARRAMGWYDGGEGISDDESYHSSAHTPTHTTTLHGFIHLPHLYTEYHSHTRTHPHDACLCIQDGYDVVECTAGALQRGVTPNHTLPSECVPHPLHHTRPHLTSHTSDDTHLECNHVWMHCPNPVLTRR